MDPMIPGTEKHGAAESDRRVIVFDTTLRDGEQAPGASMDLEQKLEVARVLQALGLDVLEAGFPVTRTAATSAPLPGSSPRSVGSVTSTLHATHNAPARIATAASARSRQPMSGEKPWITAVTWSSAVRTVG